MQAVVHLFLCRPPTYHAWLPLSGLPSGQTLVQDRSSNGTAADGSSGLWMVAQWLPTTAGNLREPEARRTRQATANRAQTVFLGLPKLRRELRPDRGFDQEPLHSQPFLLHREDSHPRLELRHSVLEIESSALHLLTVWCLWETWRESATRVHTMPAPAREAAVSTSSCAARAYRCASGSPSRPGASDAQGSIRGPVNGGGLACV